MPTFKIQGQVYHRIGGLNPAENEEQKFLQLYFVSDFQQQLKKCCRNDSKCKRRFSLEFTRNNPQRKQLW